MSQPSDAARTSREVDREESGERAGGSWGVLTVDDEPELHEVTRMLLSGVRYLGAPLLIHSADSASEAAEVLRADPDIALVLLDVVMETDDAGLRLIGRIRHEMKNDEIQIVLRTGQPGQAPEKDVVLDYDINGYFLKTEITAQKLHSIVISALRTYDHIRTLKRHRGGASFDPFEPNVSPQKRIELAAMLNTALDRDEFRLDAQPQFHLKSGHIIGIEVFLRLRNPDGIEMAPPDYLPVAGHAGLAGRIRDWVLERACRFRASWRDQGIEVGRISINVSVAQLDRGFLASLVGCLERSGLNPGQLEIEIPGKALMGSDPGVMEIVAPLQKMGVSIAVDGFGTGLASLRELKHIHPDRLKIDKSLTQGVSVDRDKSAITRSIIALAHTMDMSVVAEGIESEADLEFLRWEECEVGQGNLFAKPMPIGAIAEFMKARGRGLAKP